jgi:hypothetical protein
MTSLPSQQDMSPEQKAARKIELQQLNDECDKRLGRDSSPLFTEKGLSKETKQALDATDPQKPATESPWFKMPEGMEKKLEQFDKSISDTPAPRATQPILSLEERTRAWHKAIGSPQKVVDYEIQQLKEGKK